MERSFFLFTAAASATDWGNRVQARERKMRWSRSRIGTQLDRLCTSSRVCAPWDQLARVSAALASFSFEPSHFVGQMPRSFFSSSIPKPSIMLGKCNHDHRSSNLENHTTKYVNLVLECISYSLMGIKTQCAEVYGFMMLTTAVGCLTIRNMEKQAYSATARAETATATAVAKPT